ncbi:MAG TPA: hypothetical protein VFG05_08375 [Methylocella sp.]|nr:hypothetical protein [Methylocella sp.]
MTGAVFPAVFSGFVCGYLAASLCESLFHRIIGHASPALRRLYRKAGPPGQAMIVSWHAHHAVHHILTFRADHVTQFMSGSEQARLDAHLKKRHAGGVIACGYGLMIGRRPESFAKFMAPSLPVFLALSLLGGCWFALGAFAPFCAMPVFSQFVHPYLHMRHELVLKQGPALIRLFARTRYFKYLARHHWLHHRYMGCNYNLLLGGDVLLGVHRRAALQDLDAMRAIGLWT